MLVFDESRMAQLSCEPEWISWVSGPEGDAESLKRTLKNLSSPDGAVTPILKRAMMLSYLLRHAPVGLNPENPLSCRIRWGGLLYEEQAVWRAEGAARLAPSDWAEIRKLDEGGVFVAQLDLSHTAPDWESLLRLGLAGLRDRALQELRKTEDGSKQTFYRAVAMV